MATVRFLIAGRVQGVGFRAGTRRQAELHALYGLARNLPDGGVEVIAQGPGSAIEALALWLERGPAHARVDGVQRSQMSGAPVYSDFRIE